MLRVACCVLFLWVCADLKCPVCAVPPHSDVVFLFGEIDCREGLIVSVEKCRYRDLREGAQVPVILISFFSFLIV